MTRLAQRLGLPGYDRVRQLHADAVRQSPGQLSRPRRGVAGPPRPRGRRRAGAGHFCFAGAAPAGSVVCRRRPSASLPPPTSSPAPGTCSASACARASPSPTSSTMCARCSAPTPCWSTAPAAVGVDVLRDDRRERRAAGDLGQALRPADDRRRQIRQGARRPHRRRDRQRDVAAGRARRRQPSWCAPRRRRSFTPWRRPSPRSNAWRRWSPRGAVPRRSPRSRPANASWPPSAPTCCRARKDAAAHDACVCTARSPTTIRPRRRARASSSATQTGKDYIDASGGAAVSCLGHSHPDVIGAMRAQLDKLEYAHTSFFTTQVAEELADDLVAHAPAGLGHVFYVSGGSEAIEAALKLARQYFVEMRRAAAAPSHRPPPELSRHHARRARRSAAARWQRKPFAPLLIETHHVSPVYEYRERRADETPEAYGERLAQRARGQDRRTRRRQRHRLRRRNGRRRHAGRGRRRCPAISSACARSATATASCSSSTR